MAVTRLRPVLLSLGMLLLLATQAAAALPSGEAQPRAASLAGQLLVASPRIGDPRFSHTVILIVSHDHHGALGIVVNRPLGVRPLADLLQAIGQDSAGIAGSVRIFVGGPVEPGVGFIVHSADYHRANTIDIDNRLAMTSSAQVLLDIGHNDGPAQSLVAFGYAGWGAGQLEGEIARGDWFVEPEDPSLVFDDPRETVWDDAMARRTIPH
jgi:putative transcriptional regulator